MIIKFSKKALFLHILFVKAGKTIVSFLTGKGCYNIKFNVFRVGYRVFNHQIVETVSKKRAFV